MTKRLVIVFLMLASLAVACFSLWSWRRAGASFASEAMAATTPAKAEERVHADGRVVTRPGGQATLGTEVNGRIVRVHVVEGQEVKKGTVLAELDKREYTAMLYEAWGSAKEASVRSRARNADLKRSKRLVEAGAISGEEGEHLVEEKRAADGRLAQAGGAAARARAMLSKTRIVSPIDGVVISRFVEPHETVSAGKTLFVVADLGTRRVEAEVDEYDVGRVAVGAAAEVRADGFPGRVFTGVVEEISDAVVQKRMRPVDPARPTDSAILPVKVSLPEGSPLKLGQRVQITIVGKTP